jgi:tRNA A37 threonylcarbamoyladenosine dehydratase
MIVYDCIDSTPKLNLIIAAKRKRVKIISSMGAGGKMEAAKVKSQILIVLRIAFLQNHSPTLKRT